MKYKPQTQAPGDGEKRKAIKPVVCYPVDSLPAFDKAFYDEARVQLELVEEAIAPPREAAAFNVKSGQFFRICSVEGPQVGDLNLFNANDLSEKFYSGKARALHGTHLSTGDHMWSSFPNLRPLATITYDTLDWYGWDEFGGSVHDVIGTRCDPYTNSVLNDNNYHHCCHSNLIRAFVGETGMSIKEAEAHIHDVLNVFMCTGFMPDTKQYFMKQSPVRPGDYLEFFAHHDLLGVLSACPGGDCSASHSSEEAKCYPLKIEIYDSKMEYGDRWKPSEKSSYDGTHGLKP